MSISSSIPDEVRTAIQCCASDDSHVLNEPILLECGHSACKRCVIEKQKFRCQYPNCTYLNDFKEQKNFKSVKSIDTLIQSYLQELYEANVSEYDDLIQSVEDDGGRSSVIDKQCDDIKKRIYERAGELKKQIDTYTQNLLEKLESKKRKLKKLIRYDVDQLVPYDELDFPLTKSVFYDSQTKLLELKQILREFSKDDGNPYFEVSEIKIDDSILGKLYLTSCDSIFLKHKLLTSSNPFHQIKFTSEPYGMCVINNTYLCVSFPSLGKLCIFSDTFELIGSVDKILDSTLNCPRGIASDNCDQLIICDSFCHRLLITDHAFGELKVLGKFGTGPTEFYSPFDVLYHNAHLYVCDTGNKRIQKFTDNFGHLRSYQLDYHPMQIRILNDLIIIRDDKNYLHFYDLSTFKHFKNSTAQGVFGILGKRLYQIDSDFFYFYDSKANFNSKTRLNTELELNHGSTCMFKKNLILTGQSNLYIIENLI